MLGKVKTETSRILVTTEIEDYERISERFLRVKLALLVQSGRT